MTHQIHIPFVATARTHMRPDDAFLAFHRDHPEVYRELHRLALRAKARGFETYSIKTLWNVLRWQIDANDANDANEVFRLNDRYQARYGYLLMEREPELRGFFHQRQLKDNDPRIFKGGAQ